MNKPTTTTTGVSPILSIRIPADLLSQIDNATRETGLSRSQIVRLCLVKGVSLQKVIAALNESK